MTCMNHKIPDLQGRYAPGMTVLGQYMFVCGGHFYSAAAPRRECYKLDLDSYSPSWQSFPQLPNTRRDLVLLSYGSHIYVIGGYYYGSGSGCRSDVARITASGGSWESRAAFPRGIHRC